MVAGGCFWGVQEYYRRLKGVVHTRVGYAQGDSKYPSYEDVKTGITWHAEVVEVTFDDTLLTYEMIFDHLFRMIDPTSLHRQGGDVGTQYRTGIYFVDPMVEARAKAFLTAQQPHYKKPIVVEVEALKTFYDAEDYHQDYLIKHPQGYCHVDFSKIQPHEKK